MGNLGRNKILTNQTKEVIYNVFLYIMSIRTDRDTRPNLGKIKEEVSRATGVSVASVARIVKEGRDSESNGQVAFSREILNKKNRKFSVTGLENQNFGVEDIRRMIYKFHKTKGCHITIEALRKQLQQDYNWGGSESSMRRMLRNLGFNWTKPQNGKQKLIIKPRTLAAQSEADKVNINHTIQDTKGLEEEEEFSKMTDDWKELCDHVVKMEADMVKLEEPNRAYVDTDSTIEDVQRLAEEEFSRIPSDDWEKKCDHVIKLEAEYLKRELNIEVTVDQLVSNIKTEVTDSEMNFDN